MRVVVHHGSKNNILSNKFRRRRLNGQIISQTVSGMGEGIEQESRNNFSTCTKIYKHSYLKRWLNVLTYQHTDSYKEVNMKFKL